VARAIARGVGRVAPARDDGAAAHEDAPDGDLALVLRALGLRARRGVVSGWRDLCSRRSPGAALARRAVAHLLQRRLHKRPLHRRPRFRGVHPRRRVCGKNKFRARGAPQARAKAISDRQFWSQGSNQPGQWAPTGRTRALRP
jgi:hypothetical protein